MQEKGCYLREIAERAGCSERTVRRTLKRGGPPPKRRSGVRACKLDPNKTQVDKLLAEGGWNATMILAEIGARVMVCYEAPPGRQLQSDWGQIETMVVRLALNGTL